MDHNRYVLLYSVQQLRFTNTCTREWAWIVVLVNIRTNRFWPPKFGATSGAFNPRSSHTDMSAGHNRQKLFGVKATSYYNTLYHCRLEDMGLNIRRHRSPQMLFLNVKSPPSQGYKFCHSRQMYGSLQVYKIESFAKYF